MAHSPLYVLLIEDDPADARLTEIALKRALSSPTVQVATSVQQGREIVSGDCVPDIILLDLGLPDAMGLEGVTTLARHAPLTPIVVLTGQDDEEVALNALESGAQDYLVKGEASAELLARSIRYSLERKRAECELTRAARYDPVTGLINRAYFLALLEHALERAQRARSPVDVLFLDLDHFKNINDSLGHAAGDQLLREVGARLVRCVRASDVVARLGGDEFTIMVEGVKGTNSASIAKKILEAAQKPYLIDGVEVIVSPSIGIAGYPSSGADAATIVKHADTAMYRAKKEGRNTVEFFTEDMNDSVRKAFEREMAVRRAVSRGHFEVFYQPIVDRAGGTVSGGEALLRWQHEGETLGPEEFLPILEKTGLIRELGEWVLRSAAHQCRSWHETLGPGLRVAVNVSPAQLRANDFSELVLDVLRDSDLPAECLQLEITEQVLMRDTEANTATLTRLRELGVGVAIDDFGSGFSSLSYLTAFPFDTVKVDRSFLRNVADAGDDALLTAGILAIASSLGRKTVAEGIETSEQMAFLSAHPCDEVQGFLFSEALSAADFEAYHTESVVVGSSGP